MRFVENGQPQALEGDGGIVSTAVRLSVEVDNLLIIAGEGVKDIGKYRFLHILPIFFLCFPYIFPIFFVFPNDFYKARTDWIRTHSILVQCRCVH